MFREIRYQTGELKEVIEELKKNNIPCMDVADTEEFEWVIKELAKNEVYIAESIPYNKNARDRIKEPEFEFRAAFKLNNLEDNLKYIDFYFEPDVEKTYDDVFGD